MQAYEWLKKNMPEPVTNTTGPVADDQPQWTGLFNWTRPNSTQTSIYNKKALIRDDM